MYKSLLDVVADAQSLDELTVLDNVVLLDVGEKTTTTTDEHEQATTGVEVLRWDFMCSVSSLICAPDRMAT